MWLMLKIKSVLYLGGTKNKTSFQPLLYWRNIFLASNQSNKDRTHFFYCSHFDYTLKMLSSNKENGQIDIFPPKLAI
jgi:hypothetical protein